MKLLVVFGLFAMFVFACGGDSGDNAAGNAPQSSSATSTPVASGKLLRLAGQNITEDNYRLYLRTQALGGGFATFCAPLRGLSTADAARTLKAASGNAAPVLWTNATPVPGQQDNLADYESATGILLEECRRISN